jgi:ribosomal protein S27AE
MAQISSYYHLYEKSKSCPECGGALGELEVKRGESQYTVSVCGKCGWLERRRLR